MTQIETKVVNFNGMPQLQIHQRQTLTMEAQLACELMKAFHNSGHDSASLVAFATEVAATAFKEFEKRKWLIDLPSLKDMDAALNQGQWVGQAVGRGTRP